MTSHKKTSDLEFEIIKFIESNPKSVGKATILVIGEFTPSKLRATLTTQHRRYPQKLSKKIKQVSLPKNWAQLPMVGLLSYKISSTNTLHLKLLRTNSKEYIGTRNLSSLRNFGPTALANPLAVSACLITSDQKMVVAIRQRGDSASSIDAISGFVDPRKDMNPPGNLNLVSAIRREIREETGLTDKEIATPLCLGMAYEYYSPGEQKGLSHPVLLFIVTTSLTAEQVIERSSLSDEEIQPLIIDNIFTKNLDYPTYLLNRSENIINFEPDGLIAIDLAKQKFNGRKFSPKLYRQIEEI